jgi:hypothetical protein
MLNFFNMKNRYRSDQMIPDTNVNFKVKTDWGTFYSGRTYYAESYCKRPNSPAFIREYLIHSIDSGDANKFKATFKKRFGKDIIASELKMATTDYESFFTFYDKDGIQAAFDALYRKPGDKINGFTAQRLYSIIFKDMCRDAGNVMMKVYTQKPAFEKYAADYLTKAKTDPKFDGGNYSYATAKSLLGVDPYEDDPGCPCLSEYSSRIVSVMLRRQCDGSLPTLIACYKKMLLDYDPEYYNVIKDKM